MSVSIPLCDEVSAGLDSVVVVVETTAALVASGLVAVLFTRESRWGSL